MTHKVKTETSAGGIVFRNFVSHGSRVNTALWLIVQHSQHHGWTFPKGLIGDKIHNEPMENAALRETREEGGVIARIADPIPVSTEYTYRIEDHTLIHKTVFYYLMEYQSGDPKDHDWEMMDAKFVTEEEVLKTLTFKNDKEAFIKIKKLVKKESL